MFQPNDHVAVHADDYLHDLLSAVDDTYVEQHCQNCDSCARALADAKKRQAAMEAVPPHEASDALIRQTIERIARLETIKRRRRKRVVFTVLGIAAAVFIALGTFHVIYLNSLSLSPYDLQLLGQRNLQAGTVASLRVVLLNHDTGRAMNDIPVTISLRGADGQKSVELASFTTDDDGTGRPRFTLPDWPEGDYTLSVAAATPGNPEIATEKIHLTRAAKVMLTTDKPVYQPGQMIHIRALALHSQNLHPVAGENLTFTIADPRGTTIFKQKGATSKFGITSADCELADELIEGQYTITADLSGIETKSTVQVMKYVLPKFKIEVKLDADKKYYQPGDKVTAKVHAAYFHGKPVAHGKAKVVCQLDSRVDVTDFRSLNRETDAEGDFSFDFELPEFWKGVEKIPDDCRLTVEVTLTDTAEHEQKTSITRPVAAQPLRLYAIPEGGALVRGAANTVYLYLQQADGSPAAGMKLRIKSAVNFSPPDEVLTTNSLGIAVMKVQTKQGWASFKATDASGKPFGSQPVELQCSADFVIQTDKAIYRGGDTMHLTILGQPGSSATGSGSILIDLIKDHQTILTTTAGKSADLDLPPDLAGTLQLVAYRRGTKAAFFSQALYVRQADDVQIDAHLDHETYEPGEKAKLRLNLRDHHGRPRPGALSLSIVDEAVFSVLQQMPGMERTFFLLENDLLEPMRKVYPWSPETFTDTPQLSQADDRAVFEKALFARTAIADVQSAPPFSAARDTYEGKSHLYEMEQSWRAGVVRVTWLLVIGGLCVGGYVLIWLRADAKAFLYVHLFAAGFALALIIMILATSQLAMQKAAAPEAMDELKSRQMGYVEYATQHSDHLPPANRKFISIIDVSDSMTETTDHLGHVRSYFPETLAWHPQIITDDDGRATVDVDLADSITTWRVTAGAVTADGRLGAARSSINVSKDIFIDLDLPISLTLHDEVAVRIAVHNYSKETQKIRVALKEQPWFKLVSRDAERSASQELTLQKDEVRSVSFRIRVEKVGTQYLEVHAKSDTGAADAVKQRIQVEPNGQRIDVVTNGELHGENEIIIDLPESAIDGSGKAFLKLYPSTLSQLVEGLDGIFQMPYGCFEQTSSTTYPNVLALAYLKRTGKDSPKIRDEATRFIHLGYQRLLGFEVSGGGFSLFGQAPAEVTLTAYGLMEFSDMDRVHDVDPKLLDRTRRWLLDQRARDGSWKGNRTEGIAPGSTLDSTAYIAWAIAASKPAGESTRLGDTRSFLRKDAPGTITSPHTLALVCLALQAIVGDADGAAPYLDRLESMKKTSSDGKLIYWDMPEGDYTTFYAHGRSAQVETTALATLALLEARRSPATANRAVAWLIQQKDPHGTWHSTQATVLALKALLKAADAPLADDKDRVIDVSLGGQALKAVRITPDQSDVMEQIDLSALLKTGKQRLFLKSESDAPLQYQLAVRYHVPEAAESPKDAPFRLQLDFNKTQVHLGDSVTVKATAVNQRKTASPMVMVELPIPPGFSVDSDSLAKLKAAKYEVRSTKIVLYLTGLAAEQSSNFEYVLQARTSGIVNVPPARVYEYYDPDKQAHSAASKITIE